MIAAVVIVVVDATAADGADDDAEDDDDVERDRAEVNASCEDVFDASIAAMEGRIVGLEITL